MRAARTTPTRQDVEQLVAALFAVTSGLERARRQIPDAGALAVLQVLAWAERNDPAQQLRPKQIATALNVHRSAVTHQLQALEQAGQVTLTVDAADRRSWFVSLTDAGRQELDRLTTIGMDRFASFVADWDAEEVRTLARLLVKFEASKAEVGRRSPPQRARRRRPQPSPPDSPRKGAPMTQPPRPRPRPGCAPSC
jgi:DNA-binding MarR family transcriptional regulator